MNRRLFVVALTVFSLGCESRRERTPPPKSAKIVPADQSQYIVMIVLDLSGSFQSKMVEGGAAWQFAGQALDKYFRTRRRNRHDRFIIGQISGTRKSLLWEGTPDHFRSDFTGSSFREFLSSKADSNGSLVYDGVSHAMEYMMTISNVRKGHAKSAVLILSDMEDNGPNKAKAAKRLLDNLVAFDKVGGVGGIWYCDQDEQKKWRPALDDAGLEEFIVECDIKGRPDLPDFQ